LKRNQFEGVLTLDGFTRGLKEKEHVETSIIDVRRILPERNMMVALQCGLNDHILRITRLRSINNKPVQLEYCHLVESKFPGINDNKNFGSLYKLFEEEYGIRVIRAEQVLSVISPTEPENTHLALDESVSTIMLMKRTSYDQRNTPVEYVELFINPEGREFYMELKR
jgi:GntR family transcriptional regulator